MKLPSKLLCCTALSLFATVSYSAPSCVSQGGAFPNTASGSITITLTTQTASGDLLVAGWIVDNGLDATTPVTDSASESYTSAFSKTNIVAGTLDGGIYYFANTASGVTTVTGKQSSSGGRGRFMVSHCTGMATSSVVDTFSTFNSGNQSPWSSTAITTTNANDALFGLCLGWRTSANSVLSLSGSWSAAPSINNNYDTNGDSIAFSQQVVSSTSSYQDTGTDTGGAGVTDYSAIIAFKGSSTAVPATFPVIY